MEIKPIVTEDFVVLDDESTLSELIGKMKTFEKRVGLVFRKDKYLGLIEKKKLLKSRIDVTKTKIKNYVQNTPIINENADIIETAYLMYQSNIKYLPVERNKKIIGVISSLDLVKLASGLDELKKVIVSDVKILKPATINKTDAVATVMKIMYLERIDTVPIFDSGKLYGVITFKDLLRKYMNWSPKRNFSAKFNIFASTKSAEVDMPNLSSLPVSNFSTNDNLLITKQSEKLSKVIPSMVSNRVSDLLIMENEKFVGMLTVNNILRVIGSLKVPKNHNIKFVGLNDTKLQPYQKYNIKKIASNEAFKLQRKINNEMNLVVHLKEYDKGGRKKYSVHLRIETPGQMISSEQHDWDLETALRKTFNNAKNSVKKKFRGDTSTDKYYN